MTRKRQESVFNPGQADWVKEQATKGLSRDQRALLLALTQLEAELGRELSAEERAAVESLAESLEGYDPEKIKEAVHQMVNDPSDPDRKTSWSELKDHIH